MRRYFWRSANYAYRTSVMHWSWCKISVTCQFGVVERIRNKTVHGDIYSRAMSSKGLKFIKKNLPITIRATSAMADKILTRPFDIAATHWATETCTWAEDHRVVSSMASKQTTEAENETRKRTVPPLMLNMNNDRASKLVLRRFRIIKFFMIYVIYFQK